MKADDPRHGRRAGYLAGCRSECCTKPNYLVSKRYRLEAGRNGGRTTVDPAPVREHLKRLQAVMSLTAVADLTGSSPSHLQKVLDGAHPVMLRGLASRILAVTLDAPIGTHWIDATGSRRRLQALALVGYSFERVATMIGSCGGFNLREIAYGNRDRVRYNTAMEIRSVFERITRTGAPYKPRNHFERHGTARIIKRAMDSGWVSALAWEDGTIDDPAARPLGLITSEWDPAGYDETRIERRINGDRTVRLHRGESVEVVRRLLADGASQNEIRRRTGLKPERYMPEIRAEQRSRQEAAA